ncbi:hypothetical protein K1Y80_21940 [Streptomyces sp. MAG02]|nr:hypothetical protein [Streptomyces sp. MAG02]
MTDDARHAGRPRSGELVAPPWMPVRMRPAHDAAAGARPDALAVLGGYGEHQVKAREQGSAG